MVKSCLWNGNGHTKLVALSLAPLPQFAISEGLSLAWNLFQQQYMFNFPHRDTAPFGVFDSIVRVLEFNGAVGINSAIPLHSYTITREYMLNLCRQLFIEGNCIALVNLGEGKKHLTTWTYKNSRVARLASYFQLGWTPRSRGMVEDGSIFGVTVKLSILSSCDSIWRDRLSKSVVLFAEACSDIIFPGI